MNQKDKDDIVAEVLGTVKPAEPRKASQFHKDAEGRDNSRFFERMDTRLDFNKPLAKRHREVASFTADHYLIAAAQLRHKRHLPFGHEIACHQGLSSPWIVYVNDWGDTRSEKGVIVQRPEGVEL